MNRPKQVLLEAATADLTEAAQTLREQGWDAQVEAFDNAADGFGVRIQIQLDGATVVAATTPKRRVIQIANSDVVDDMLNDDNEFVEVLNRPLGDYE